jgi:hypothetical protein
VHLDVAVERARRVLEPEVALAAAEERLEDLPEVLAGLRERREEEFACGHVDLPDRLLQRRARLLQVRALPGEEVESPHLLLVLLDGERVDDAELLELLPHLGELAA